MRPPLLGPGCPGEISWILSPGSEGTRARLADLASWRGQTKVGVRKRLLEKRGTYTFGRLLLELSLLYSKLKGEGSLD